MVVGGVVVAICYPQGCFAPFVLCHSWWTPILRPVSPLLCAPFVVCSTVPFLLLIYIIRFSSDFRSGFVWFWRYPSVLLFHCLDALLDGTCWLGPCLCWLPYSDFCFENCLAPYLFATAAMLLLNGTCWCVLYVFGLGWWSSLWCSVAMVTIGGCGYGLFDVVFRCSLFPILSFYCGVANSLLLLPSAP
jgi:hypothetical protein